MKLAPWWQFWNPLSGWRGGMLFGVILWASMFIAAYAGWHWP